MRFKKTLITLGIVLVIFIGLNSAKAYYDGQVYQGYVPNQPTKYTERNTIGEESYISKTFTFEGIDGTQIPVSAALPKDKQGPFPTIIMLYGIGQKMTFLEDIAEEIAPHGFAIYMMEQYLRGERKVEGVASDLHEFGGLRERATLNAVETRRLVDTISIRPEVDSQSIYLWGVSFGTITGVPTFAQEPRFKGAVFSIGGGDVHKMFTDSKSFAESGTGGKLMNSMLAWYLKPIDPILYTDNMSGRPILFQNAEQDEIIPRSAAEALHNAVGEPKEIIWYDTDHEGKINDQAVNYFKDGVAWLKKQEGMEEETLEPAA